MSPSSADIAALVAALIDHHQYEPPALGSTVGVPWSAEKVATHVALLKQSIVPPRLESFVLSETYEQISASTRAIAKYWVVAECEDCVEWYDPSTKEFGLGQRSSDGSGLVSIGVRGDLIGVFCAM